MSTGCCWQGTHHLVLHPSKTGVKPLLSILKPQSAHRTGCSSHSFLILDVMSVRYFTISLRNLWCWPLFTVSLKPWRSQYIWSRLSSYPLSAWSDRCSVNDSAYLKFNVHHFILSLPFAIYRIYKRQIMCSSRPLQY